MSSPRLTLAKEAALEAGAIMIITADHGNVDMMFEVDRATGDLKRDPSGNPVIKTSHTLSPVPWFVVGSDAGNFVANPEVTEPGLGNIAATILLVFGFEAPTDYLPPLVVPILSPHQDS